jgi:hypothetical protein
MNLVSRSEITLEETLSHTVLEKAMPRQRLGTLRR